MGSELWWSQISRRELLRGGVVLGLAGPAIVAAACGGTSAPANETVWQRIQRTKVVNFGLAIEPPFSVQNPDGTVTGELADLVNAVFKDHYNLQPKPVVSVFSSLIPGLLAKRFDVISAGLAITPARCAQIAYGLPDTTLGNCLIVKKGNPKNIHSYADIASNSSVKVGVPQGTPYVDLAKAAGIPDSRVLQFSDPNVSATVVADGRVDVFAWDQASGALIVTKAAGVELANPYTEPPGVTIYYLASGFRKEDTDFVAAYDKAMTSIQGNGTLKNITQKYGLGLPDPKVTPAQVCGGG